jgi:putative lipoic acid-binding regulatory protein
MTQLQQEVIAKIQDLAPEDVEKVLHFVETLAPAPAPAASQRRSLRGRYAHLGVHISAHDIDEARTEAWADFHRDISMD